MSIDPTSKPQNLENVKALLIEDDPADVRIILEVLKNIKGMSVEVKWVTKLSEGLSRLAENDFDVIFLDLMLPDSTGLDTLKKLKAYSSKTAIIVLIDNQDEDYGVKALDAGAQDYLIKDELTGKQIGRSLRYALQRNKFLKKARALSFNDELTGLYNRRGFEAFAPNILDIAARADRKTFLFFVDMDNLKVINDKYGHKERDKAVKETAKILKETFRKSDIIAKIGEDDFAILTLQPVVGNRQIIIRLGKKIFTFNAKKGSLYDLSVKIGIAPCSNDKAFSIDNLSKEAAKAIYTIKRKKKEMTDLVS
jgi:diguanylate cyclase (GGDEF)-like protein